MSDSGIVYAKSFKGLVRIALMTSGFLASILVVSARFCEGASAWVAFTYLLSVSLSLASFVIIISSQTSRIQFGIPYKVRKNILKKKRITFG